MDFLPCVLHYLREVLIRAGAGTGKTWSMQQLLFLLATAARGAGDGVRCVREEPWALRSCRLDQLSSRGPPKIILVALFI